MERARTKSDGKDWMTAYTNHRLISTFKSLSNYASLTVIIVGLLVLFGWVFGIQALTSVLPGPANMKVNAALAFVLAGFSLWLALTNGENQWRDVIAKACAMLTALIGLLTLGEYVFSQDFGIDLLLIKDPLTPENAFPGRMAPTTALNFSLLGFALLIQNRSQHRWPAQVFSFTVLLISMLALIGYAYGIPSLYDFFLIPP